MCQIIEDEIRELIANGTDADDISQKLSRYFPSVMTVIEADEAVGMPQGVRRVLIAMEALVPIPDCTAWREKYAAPAWADRIDVLAWISIRSSDKNGHAALKVKTDVTGIFKGDEAAGAEQIFASEKDLGIDDACDLCMELLAY